jgi:Anticodon binding domain/tRNA synthetase class II core domain (G, H, P, S and T)
VVCVLERDVARGWLVDCLRRAVSRPGVVPCSEARPAVRRGVAALSPTGTRTARADLERPAPPGGTGRAGRPTAAWATCSPPLAPACATCSPPLAPAWATCMPPSTPAWTTSRPLLAIEVGHIFKLGYKYSEALDLSVVGPQGGRVRPIMGSYGIGVERAIAAVVERHHDAAGIVWPVQVAPFVVALVVLDPTDPETGKVSQTISEQLTTAGIDVIVDDRDDRPGVKFRDVELVGIPYRITIGARDLANGTVELLHRVSGNKEALPVGAAADRILALVTAATTT